MLKPMSLINDEAKMPTKTLRILIADTDPDQALKMERALNLLGYYRIAPLYSPEALVSLRAARTNEYDVLLISQEMAGGGIVGDAEFRMDNSQFRHVLIYADADSFANQLATQMSMLDSSLQP
jgi:hypothetical protein